MANKLDEIKDFILSKYPQFNVGYANVCKLDGTNIVLDEKKQLYAGIDDTKGNMFYIRELKNATYTPYHRGAKVAYYSATIPCRIVAVYSNGNEDIVLKMLINSINSQRHSITKSNKESTTVFKEETGKTLTKSELTIVSIDFDIVSIVSPKDCSLNPCNC